MLSIITGRSASKNLVVWAALTAGVVGAGCHKTPLLAPGLSVISLSAASTVIQSNGSTQVSANVSEFSGIPVHNGTHVTFSTDLGSVSPTDATTVNGVATVQFAAKGQSGIANVHASSGSAKDPAATTTSGFGSTIKLTVGAAAASRVSVSANPGTVPSSGGSSTIVASIVDGSGNALSGVTVTFSTNAGSLSTAVATTDSSGNAQTTLTTNKVATVTATAGGASGSTSAVPSGTVTVNVNSGPTVPVFTASPSAPAVGQAVGFNVSATAGGSPVQRIVVDFGDGASTTITGSNGGATHTYGAAATYVARATAFDTFGDSGSATVTVTVASAPKPTVSLSASGSGTAGSVTTFTIGVTPAAGFAITDVRMTFGDGGSVDLGASSGSSQTVQHAYQTGGSYTATATANDSSGGTASASTVIVVSQPLQVALSAMHAGFAINFTATVSPPGAPVSNYHWVYGDGNSADTTGNTSSHIYVMGSYTASVTVTAPNGQTATSSVSFGVP